MTTDLRESGVRALQAGDSAAALAAFERAIAAGDASAETALMRAIALAKLERVGDARSAVQEILQRHVGFAPALELLERLDAMTPDETPRGGEGAWQVGSVVHDRWEVFGSAEGGMGRVWFVRDRAWDGMELAVKTLRIGATDRAQIDRAKRLFRRESQVWLDLGGHSNIVSGFYTIELDEMLRFFMEYVPGRTLGDWLRAARALPIEDVLDQAIQLASGVEYVHARGVVHRDLKPANCLVMEDGTLRITDFGLSRADAAEDDAPADAAAPARFGDDMSAAGAGTPAYMAPEQWRSLGSAGRPADVYALGVTMYELLAGRRPFGADRASWDLYAGRLPANVEAVARAESPIPDLVLRLFHEHVAPLPLAELNVDVPRDIEELVVACLVKDPGARPAAGALREQLVACYTRHVGTYPRELPRSLAPTAIGENNRAVSYFVMGEVGVARKILDGVLERDATALFPWINRASLALAAGEIEPAAVAEQLAHFVLNAHPGMAEDRDVELFTEQVASSYLAHEAPVIALDARAGSVASLTAIGEVSRWEPGARAPRRLARLDDATGVAFVGGAVAVAAGESLTILRDDGTRSATRCSAHLTALAGRADDSVVIAGDAEGNVTVWWPRQPAQTHLRGRGLIRAVATCDTTAMVAAASLDGGFAVWDASRGGRSLFTDRAGCLACYVNGAWGIAVAGGADGVVRVWDLPTSSLRAALRGHTRAVTGIAFARDGTLVTAGADGTLRTWDARRGVAKRTWRLHHAPIRALCLEHGEVAVTAGDDHAVRRTHLSPQLPEPRLVVRKDVSAIERRRRLDERDRVVTGLESGDLGALAAARALRRRVPELARDDRLREAEHTGASALGVPVGVEAAYTQWSRRLPWPAARLALHPAGTGLAVAGDLGNESELQLWDADGTCRAELGMPRILAMIWARDGRSLWVATLDNKVRRLVAPTLEVAWTGEWAKRGGVRGLACGPGDEVFGCGWARSAMRTSLQATGCVRSWRGAPRCSGFDRWGEELVALATTTDGGLVAAARERGDVLVWDAIRRRRAGNALAHGGEVVGIVFAGAGARLVAASGDGRWTSWRWRRAHVEARAEHVGGLTTARMWSGDRHLVTGGRDGAARIWDLARGVEIGVMRGHSGPVLCEARRDRRGLVTAGHDGVLHSWNVELEWLLGEEALDHALAAVSGHASRAWPATSGDDDLVALEHALDVWRDIERAGGLAARWPGPWRELRERVLAIARAAARTNEAEVAARLAGTSLGVGPS